MKNNEIKFKKRVDYHRAYRDEISKDASKISFAENKRIAKIKQDIQKLDQSILDAINIDIDELSKGISADINFSDNYSKLVFSIDGVNEKLIEELNESLEKANKVKEQNFVIDNDQELIDLQLPKDIKAKEVLQSLDSKYATLSNEVQNFPDRAKESLHLLNDSVEKAKTQKEAIDPNQKVSIARIEDTKDVKWTYFISFGTSLFTLLVIIIMIVLIIVLW